MRSEYQVSAALFAFVFSAPSLAGDWIQFVNETQTRLIADASVGAQDTKEKDYAWGDVDRDGDIDLVVVRKEMGTNSIGYRNVLFMLEGKDDGHAIDGVLVDRTTEYIPQFLDITNDRDVALVDLDGDGWLDMVTVTACNGCKPSPELLPRIYMNQGEDRGTWQGFVWEPARMPSFPITPNFCGVGFGDVTGDGAADLYLTDYFNTLEDRLLINNGNGFFSDQTASRVSPWLNTSEFSVHAVIADLNHDGYNDIIKNSALNPYQLRLAYNDPENVGFFTNLPDNGQALCACSNYFIAVGDLNNDGLLDVVELDDADDRYFLNQGNGPDGQVNWIPFVLPDSNNGFDENTVIIDLDNDGFNDIIVADVGVDSAHCLRRMDIHHNLGNPPFVTFEEDVGNLPTEEEGPLRGTHDVAVLDLDGDCWLDLVIGSCSGTTIWINQGLGNICAACTGDLDNDGSVGDADLVTLLNAWGPNPGHPADFDGNGNVGASDLLTLLANWGPCP